MDRLTFEEEPHVYRWDGAIVSSTTGVIKAAGFMPRTYPEGVAHLGTLVHKMVKLEVEDDLVEDGLDPFLVPRLAAFREWRALVNPKIISAERRLFHPTIRVAGTLDLLVEIAGALWLIDVKSGVAEPWHSVQTAGYAFQLGAQGVKVKHRAGLYLKADGKHKFEHHPDSMDEADFLACVTVERFIRKNYPKKETVA